MPNPVIDLTQIQHQDGVDYIEFNGRTFTVNIKTVQHRIPRKIDGELGWATYYTKMVVLRPYLSVKDAVVKSQFYANKQLKRVL